GGSRCRSSGGSDIGDLLEHCAGMLWTAIATIPLTLILSQRERMPRLALPLEGGGFGGVKWRHPGARRAVPHNGRTGGVAQDAARHLLASASTARISTQGRVEPVPSTPGSYR